MVEPKGTAQSKKENTAPAHSFQPELFQLCADRMNVGIYITDEQGILVFWNEALERITNMRAADALGKSVWQVQFDLLPKKYQTAENRQCMQEKFLGMLRSGETEYQGDFLDFEHYQPSGKKIFLLGTTCAVQTPRGYCLISFSIDVTKRRQSEERLKISETKFRSVVEQAGDGILIFDSQEKIIECNQRCEQVTGFSCSQANGMLLSRLLPDLFGNVDWQISAPDLSLHDLLTRNLPLVARSHLPRMFEGPVLHANGIRKWINAVMFPVHVENNQLYGMIIRDVTSIKQNEQRLERYARQLETLRRTGLEISAELGLDALVWMIAPRVVELLNGAAMALYLYNPEKGRLELAISIGDNQPHLEKYARYGEHLAGRVWENGKSVLLEDYHTGYTENLGKSYWGKVAGAPIVWSSEFLGVVFVFSDQTFYETDLKMLELFSSHAAAAIRNARQHHQVSQLAVTDALTGIYNRRHFFEVAEKQFRDALRYKRAFSVVMFDLDYFKKVNDTFGHARGDEILRAVVHRCVENIRQSDTIGRYGGEEFAIALPQTDGNHGLTLIERLREKLSTIPVETDSTPALVTASFGIASLTPETTDLMTLLGRADVALYHAKQAGRDRCVLWTDDMQNEIPQA